MVVLGGGRFIMSEVPLKGPRSLQLLDLLEVQGYLAHAKIPDPQNHHRTLGPTGIGL